ncbi:hypothetical protein ACLOJK_024299 [Asimina triloba]
MLHVLVDDGARSYGRRKSARTFVAPRPELGHTTACFGGSDFPGLRVTVRGTAPGTERGVIIRWDKRRKKRMQGCNASSSQEVTHPSTTLAQAR